MFSIELVLYAVGTVFVIFMLLGREDLRDEADHPQDDEQCKGRREEHRTCQPHCETFRAKPCMRGPFGFAIQ